MARIELSQSTLAKIKKAIELRIDTIEGSDLLIEINYKKKNITVKNSLTGQEFDLNCRDRRLIFKYFEK